MEDPAGSARMARSGAAAEDGSSKPGVMGLHPPRRGRPYMVSSSEIILASA